MTLFFSKLISLLFHPLFMPVFGLMLVLETEGYYQLYFSPSQKQALYLLFGMLTVLMPLISMYILVRNRFVSGFHMPRREERFLPYIQSVVYFGMLYYFLRTNNLNGPFCAGLLGSVLVLVSMIGINMAFKISAHTAGIGGVTGIYAGLMKLGYISDGILTLAALIVLCGIVGTARLSLHAHRPLEIYAGLAAGFLIEFLTVSFDLYI